MRRSSFQFANACQALAIAARHAGLEPPSFRTPPRLDGADRTIRRRGPASAVVAVAVRDRPWVAVLADLVEGVVVANGLTGSDALRARSALWEAVAADITGEAA